MLRDSSPGGRRADHGIDVSLADFLLRARLALGLLVCLSTLASARPPAFRQPLHELLQGQTRPVLVINVPARLLRAHIDGRLAFECPVAVGRHEYPGVEENTRTRLGSYRIETWATGYATKEHPVPWTQNLWKGAFGVHTAILGPDALYQHLHGTVGPVELSDWIITRTPPRERRPDENERSYREYLEQIEYGLSHGCVRVSNENIQRLRKRCPVGTRVHKIYCLVERFDETPPAASEAPSAQGPAGHPRVTVKYYPNIYRYDDIDNGEYWPERAQLVEYHHPEDNEQLGPALPRSED